MMDNSKHFETDYVAALSNAVKRNASRHALLTRTLSNHSLTQINAPSLDTRLAYSTLRKHDYLSAFIVLSRPLVLVAISHIVLSQL